MLGSEFRLKGWVVVVLGRRVVLGDGVLRGTKSGLLLGFCRNPMPSGVEVVQRIEVSRMSVLACVGRFGEAVGLGGIVDLLQ